MIIKGSDSIVVPTDLIENTSQEDLLLYTSAINDLLLEYFYMWNVVVSLS